ncbi:MAG: LytTR family DNA-binding domain-containing protein [Bacteroidota bacterium]
MIRSIIIDDEKDARYVLRNMLEKHFKTITIVGEADDVESGLNMINENKPDLVFLDIQMRKGTGFDLLNRIKNIDFEVVFVTAHNQYAIDAFKFSAFGYLLKPIKITDLEEVIERFEKQFESLKNNINQRLKVLVENYGNEGEIRKLIINTIEGFQVVRLKDIIRLEADRNYTHFFVESGKKITTSKNLGEYEELLNDYGFFRIHQSTIISLRHVTGFQKGDGGIIRMTDGANLKLSRYRKEDFLRRFS